MSQLVKENEISDMELTNCETTVHTGSDSPPASLCLCSPESLLKPLRALETTILHASQHEHLAENDALPNPTMRSYLSGLPNEDRSRVTNITMEFTCQDTAHLSTDSDLHLICEVPSLRSSIDPPNTNSKSNDDHSSCNRDTDIPSNVNTAAAHTPSQSSDQFITKVPPQPLKLKQTPSNTKLLLASPYTDTPHREGIVYLDTPVADDDLHCDNTTTNTLTNMPLEQGCDNHHVLNQENSVHTISLRNPDIEHKPCHDLSSPAVLNDTHHNWLQDADRSGFALVPVSCSPVSQMPASTVSQPNHEISSSVNQPFPLPPSPASLVDYLTAASTIDTGDEMLVINSPQVVPVKCSAEPNVSGDLHSFSFIGDLSMSQGSRLLRQSLRMSPSVFSKFLTKLESDRSVPVDSSDINGTMDDSAQISSDTVSMLSSSLASTHITNTSDHVNSDEDKDSSMTSQGTIGTFSALLQQLIKR